MSKLRSLAGFASALLLAVSTLLPACKSTGDDKYDETRNWSAERLYNEAKAELLSGDYKKAIEYYQKLEARYPYGRYAQQAQLELAYAYYKDVEPVLALAETDRFIKLYPEHPSVDCFMGSRPPIRFLSRKSEIDSTRGSPGGPLGAAVGSGVGGGGGGFGASFIVTSTAMDLPAASVTSFSSVISPSFSSRSRYSPGRMLANRTSPPGSVTPSRATGPAAVTLTASSEAPNVLVTCTVNTRPRDAAGSAQGVIHSSPRPVTVGSRRRIVPGGGRPESAGAGTSAGADGAGGVGPGPWAGADWAKARPPVASRRSSGRAA